LEFSMDLGKESSMKGKRFTEEQIIAVLKEHEAGTRLGRSTWRYKSRLPADEEVRTKLRELALKRTRFGYGRTHRGRRAG
jgi:hypothetical protein